MSKSADGEPPLLPILPLAENLPPGTVLPIPVESRVTTVARVVAIVRDVVVILFVAFLLFMGFGIAGRISESDVVGDVSTDTPACPSPRVDQWGTFCPETPGG